MEIRHPKPSKLGSEEARKKLHEEAANISKGLKAAGTPFVRKGSPEDAVNWSNKRK